MHRCFARSQVYALDVLHNRVSALRNYADRRRSGIRFPREIAEHSRPRDEEFDPALRSPQIHSGRLGRHAIDTPLLRRQQLEGLGKCRSQRTRELLPRDSTRSAIPLQRRLGHGESFERLHGGLHRRNAHLLATTRSRYGRRRYRSRMPHVLRNVILLRALQDDRMTTQQSRTLRLSSFSSGKTVESLRSSQGIHANFTDIDDYKFVFVSAQPHTDHIVIIKRINLFLIVQFSLMCYTHTCVRIFCSTYLMIIFTYCSLYF